MGKRTLLFFCFILCIEAFARAQEQGQFFTISEIHISGNKLTRESVILRELPFRQGDTLSLEVLRSREARARELILNTSLFNTVNIDDTVYGDKVDIYIRVKERFPLEPTVHFAIADRNFNGWWQDR